jgi:putative CocE/NonD family hydrolase
MVAQSPGTTLSMLETDRYWRARAYTGGIKNNPNYEIAAPWNALGYAYVFADLRGTGASFGALTAELGSAMIADVGSLADWIAARPWSNGRVGVTGVSYAADTAMLSLALRDHHITAAAPIQLLPADGKATYRISRSAASPSYLDLPVIN